jgi:UDP-GlcNAc:undecaprenyl-phosphate GlcNAc-1-phosphate transferase
MLHSELWRYLSCGVVSCVLAVALTIFLRWLAPRIGMEDRPDARKDHPRPTPLLGGVGVFLAAVSCYAFFGRLDGRSLWLVAGSLVVLALGVWDDRVGLRARFRLAIQIAAAIAIAAAGFRLQWFAWAPLNWAATLLWLAGVMNAMNCMDSADGIAAGIACVAAAAFAAIALAYGQSAVALMAIAVAGSCLGFLIFNFPPASIFLGDAGSTSLGLLLGSMAISASRGAPVPSQILLVGLPLLLPVWDIVLVHLRRWGNGTRGVRALLESAGRDHLPHRLRQAGLRPRQVAVTVYLMTVVCAIPGVLMVYRHLSPLAFAVEIALIGLVVGELPFGAAVARLTRLSSRATSSSGRAPRPADMATENARPSGGPVNDWPSAQRGSD